MEVSPILSILVALACILAASLTIVFANATILHDGGDGG